MCFGCGLRACLWWGLALGSQLELLGLLLPLSCLQWVLCWRLLDLGGGGRGRAFPRAWGLAAAQELVVGACGLLSALCRPVSLGLGGKLLRFYFAEAARLWMMSNFERGGGDWSALRYHNCFLSKYLLMCLVLKLLVWFLLAVWIRKYWAGCGSRFLVVVCPVSERLLVLGAD